MKYYIIAGEASGDLHGANFMKALLKNEPDAEIRFWGGDLMQQEGGTLVKHYKDLDFMGFVEVLMNLRTILKNLDSCKKDILEFQPDVLLFIDYPGFNMRIAKWAKKQGFSTHYYISPQIWAWNEKRIHAIKKYIDHMYVILPFEKEYYWEKHQHPVDFVGHPLLDAIARFEPMTEEAFRKEAQLDTRPVIALLPGSRKQEVTKNLEMMISLAAKYPQYNFVIAGAPSLPFSIYEPFLMNQNVGFVSNKTYDLLTYSHAAIVTSGTATLETALFGVPQVVVYKANRISYEIAKRILSIKYISLVNLIMDEEVVKELIQGDYTLPNLEKSFELIIKGNSREKILEKYRLLKTKLGESGVSENLYKMLKSNINFGIKKN